MNKEEAIELLKNVVSTKPDCEFEKFRFAKIVEFTEISAEEIAYLYLVEKGIINVTQISIDVNKILMVEDGSVDIEALKKKNYEVIVYRQGSRPPEWLK